MYNVTQFARHVPRQHTHVSSDLSTNTNALHIALYLQILRLTDDAARDDNMQFDLYYSPYNVSKQIRSQHTVLIS